VTKKIEGIALAVVATSREGERNVTSRRRAIASLV